MNNRPSKNPARCLVQTTAYNAEKTLRRAIESVLNQTFTDFRYNIRDNGSTDGTYDIINEYAARDSRISLTQNKLNYQILPSPKVLSSENASPANSAAICRATLDADDEYKPDFLARTVPFLRENNLDMVFCGSEYIQDGSSRLDTPPRTRILENEDIIKFLPEYYQFATRYWGILYRQNIWGGLIHLITAEAGMQDSKNVLHGLEKSARIGVLAESLHKYYRAPKTLSRKYNPNWFWWVNEMYEQTRLFILSRGPLTPELENFLWVRYLIWLKYILPRIQQSDASAATKISDIIKIFKFGRTEALMRQDWGAVGIYSDKAEFLDDCRAWLESFTADEALRPYLEVLRGQLASYRQDYGRRN